MSVLTLISHPLICHFDGYSDITHASTVTKSRPILKAADYQNSSSLSRLGVASVEVKQ